MQVNFACPMLNHLNNSARHNVAPQVKYYWFRQTAKRAITVNKVD